MSRSKQPEPAGELEAGFAPSVVVDGRTVQPEGWMWVLSFALAGVPWAVETASTNEFRERCRAGLKAMRDREAESEIAHLERRIAVLKAGLTPNVEFSGGPLGISTAKD